MLQLAALEKRERIYYGNPVLISNRVIRKQSRLLGGEIAPRTKLNFASISSLASFTPKPTELQNDRRNRVKVEQ